MNKLSELYRETIKKHAAKPVGYRRQIDATHEYEEYNPLCGDRILMKLRIEQGQVKAVGFEGEACAICMASASLLCCCTADKPVSHLEWLYNRLVAALENDQETEGIEELQPLLGVKPYPSRIRCATLPWSAAGKALQ